MDVPIWRKIIWVQFGAAIDMIENAIIACPDSLWSDRSQRPEYWYVVYHTIFWLDLYLSDSVEKFMPPEPFTLDEMQAEENPSQRVYTKDELLEYLKHGRNKCRMRIESLTDEVASSKSKFEWVDASNAEMYLYNMRHVQHHAAQLNLILRQQTDSAPGWVAKAKDGNSE